MGRKGSQTEATETTKRQTKTFQGSPNQQVGPLILNHNEKISFRNKRPGGPVGKRRRPIYKMTKLGRLHMLQTIPEYRDVRDEYSFRYRKSMSRRRTDLNTIQYGLMEHLKPSTNIEEPLVVTSNRSPFEY